MVDTTGVILAGGSSAKSEALGSGETMTDGGQIVAKSESGRVDGRAASASQVELDRLAHDLNAPITYLVGYAEMLAHGQIDPRDVPDVAVEIYREACRMADMVAVMVEASRAQQRRTRLSITTFDLNDVVERVHARWRLARPDLHITAIGPARCPIAADHDRVAVALNGLLELVAGPARDGAEPEALRLAIERAPVGWTIEIATERPSDQGGTLRALTRRAAAAIAAAHGGTLEACPRGFRLTLPGVAAPPTAEQAAVSVAVDGP